VVPDGLEMLASKQTANFNKWIRLGHRYSERDGKRTLLFQVFFPECVATDDGTRTGNPILRYQDMPGEASQVVNSHVSYPGHWRTRNEAGCPPSHPYRYPAPIGTISFSAMGDNPYLASDMIGEVPLESFHADYIAGIPPETNEKMLKCIKESRRCEFTGSRGQLPERFYAPNGTKVYKYDMVVYPEIDRTPFDKYFTPMMSGSQHNH
jgi:hypothetical protein